MRTNKLLNLRDVPLCICRFEGESRFWEFACATRAAVLSGDQAISGWSGELCIARRTDCIGGRERATALLAREGSRAWH